MPPKSIFRQPGAKHFQLVHRSQRDPLIHDTEASQHVLRPFVRENEKKGKSRTELEVILGPSNLSDERPNVGEASLYGVYFDDTEYDYMQHLRTAGVHEDGVESVLLEAPSSSKPKNKSKSKGIEISDLPEDVLASKNELPRTYESQQAVPESIAGFNPDMDPHLRQVLEALDDDEFVDDDLDDDDFFGDLVGGGERGSDEEIDFEFSEWGVSEGEKEGNDEDKAGWEARFAQFKRSQAKTSTSDDEFDESEGGDTISGLPQMSVIGGKGRRRKKGSSDASGYSMSSSSMFRNEHLQTLDEQFDQVMLKDYNDDIEGDENEEVDHDSDSSADSAPELITSRADFESMVSSFLEDHEIVGRKMKPRLEGETGAEKLETLRRAMGQDERVRRILGDFDEEEVESITDEEEDQKNRWDCETILTTYSNLENHPRLIKARNIKPVPKIQLDPKTGFPSAEERTPLAKSVKFSGSSNTSDDDSEDEVVTHRTRAETVARPRNENKEDKKARKAAVKAERASRRVEKKSTRQVFGAQKKEMSTRRNQAKEASLKKL